jgi:hypothetical protein
LSETKINLTGWQAVVVLFVLTGVVVARFMTLGDKKDDSALMRELKVQLTSDYFPNEVAKLQAAYDSGDAKKLQDVAVSVTTAKLNIESVRVSYHIFDFSTPKDVIVKVTYSLGNASGTRDRKTKYYLFSYGSIGNVWRYKHKTSVVNYYLNFL